MSVVQFSCHNPICSCTTCCTVKYVKDRILSFIAHYMNKIENFSTKV